MEKEAFKKTVKQIFNRVFLPIGILLLAAVLTIIILLLFAEITEWIMKNTNIYCGISQEDRFVCILGILLFSSCGIYHCVNYVIKLYHKNLDEMNHIQKKDYLILPIKKQWFDMICSGEKTEEYREIKPYWEKRFKKHFGWNFGGDEILEWHFDPKPKQILFRNGYSKNAPALLCECTIRIGTGKEEWGAEKGTEYYVLEIRKIQAIMV